VNANVSAAVGAGCATFADGNDQIGFAAARDELVLPPFFNCIGNVG